MPNGADLLVVSLADRDQQERLRLLAATGPHYAPGLLASASTRTIGVAQLSDVTATILQRGGVLPESPISGRAVSVVPVGQQQRVDGRRQGSHALTDVDTKADAMHRVIGPFLLIWIIGTAADDARPVDHAAPLRAVEPAPRPPAGAAPRARRRTHRSRYAGRDLRRQPPAVVAMVDDDGRAHRDAPRARPRHQRRAHRHRARLSVELVVARADGRDVGAHSRHHRARPHHRLAPADQLDLRPATSARRPLLRDGQTSAFALYGSAVLLLCAALAHALRRRGAPRLAVAVVLVVAGLALAVDVLPAWGADFGGPIALVPALGLLLLGVMEVRATWRNVGTRRARRRRRRGTRRATSTGCRPVDERSHPVRFLQTVIDGGAWDVMSRRLVGNIETVLSVPLLAVVVTMSLRVVRRSSSPDRVRRARSRSRASSRRAPLLHRALWCIILMAAIGFVTNDSGAAIPPVAALFTVPAVISAVMHFLTVEARKAPVRRRRDRHHL